MAEEPRTIFEPALIELMKATDEVDMETIRPSGERVRTTIWILTDGHAAYIRSEHGTAGRWYRDLIERPEGAVHIEGRRVPVRAVPASDPATIALVSDLFREKYGKRHRASTAAMLQPITLETTLRLDPA